MSYFTAVVVKYETMAYRLLNLTIKKFWNSKGPGLHVVGPIL